jgi:hypothetical protein
MSRNEILYLNQKTQHPEQPRDAKRRKTHVQPKTAPTLLTLMGSLDWLTTVIGIVCFGAVEGNPFLAGLAVTNLPVFTVIKLGTAVSVGFLFYQGEKTVHRATNQDSKGFKRVHFLLKGAYAASLAFLVFAVLNNVWALLSATA